MIYQNLALAFAATSSLAVAAKPTYFAAITTTPVGVGKVYDNRGWIQTTSYTMALGTIDAQSYPTTVHGSYTTPAVTNQVPTATGYIRDQSVPSKISPTFFTAFQTNTTGNRGDGTVHVYGSFKRTSLKQWSQTQTLRAPSQFNKRAYFGSSIATDVSRGPLLAVGCSGCNASSTIGQVYLYSSNPSGDSWSQSQVLSLDAVGYTSFGRDVQLNENTLLASVKNPSGVKSYVAFQRGPGPKDSFEAQQLLGVKGASASSASVYEDTIVIGNGAATHTSLSSAGEVYILHPSSEKSGPGKARPVQWSVQQVLRAAAPAASGTFGSSVSINRNTLAVAAGGSGNSYVFTREDKSGQWSQQQVFTTATPYSVSLAGGNMVVSKGTSYNTIVTLYGGQSNWKCLRISLEDQFGDGWDTAELIASAPDGTHDYFSLGCDSPNPVQLRYCPNDRSDGGVYSFSIPEAVKAKFHWELQWSIFDENTGVWYRGQWDTKMDFEWDSDSLMFVPRKVDKARANFTYCHTCPSRPTDKPTPVLRRNLKFDDGSGTAFPTHTPAPTLLTTITDNWRSLSLVTGGKPWFDYLYQGTEYYFSDPHGHRLIASGTTCKTTGTESCWVDLPDGDYTLRLGGALDPNIAVHKFRYCKIKKDQGVQSQLNFRIQDGDCFVTTFASRDAVCKSNGYFITSKFYLVLNVNMIVHGSTITTPTIADNTVFSSAVASLFKGMQSSDVTLVSVTPSGSSTFVNANIRMSSELGYNLLDVDEELAFESHLKDVFSSKSNELSLAVALTSGAVASTFSHVTKVEFVDYRIVDSLEVASTEATNTEIDEVTSYSDAFTSSTTESTSDTDMSKLLINSISYSGYFLAVFGVLLVAGFVIYKTQTSSSSPSNTHLPVPEDSETSSKIENGRRRSAPSTKALTASDLQELATMEQEYLKIVTK